MRDQFLISGDMLDDFEIRCRRRRWLAMATAGDTGWMSVLLSAIFLATAIVVLFAGNDVFGLILIACVPVPAVAFGIVLLVMRREIRQADKALLVIDGIRRRGPVGGGHP